MHLPCSWLYDDVCLVRFAFREGCTAIVLGVSAPLCGNAAVGHPVPPSSEGIFSMAGLANGSVADFYSHPAFDGSFTDLIWRSAQLMVVHIC